MLTKLAMASIAVALVSGTAVARTQPPAHTGDLHPFVPAHGPAALGPSLGMAMLSATVDATGTIVHGAGTTGSSYIATGTYEVDFDRDVSACTYASVVGTPDSGSAQGQSDVAPRSGTADGVFVETLDSSGNAKDLPFHLIVFCAN